MKRREALRNTAFLAGCGLSAGTIASIIGGCKNQPAEYAESFLGSEYVHLLGEITETILPTTDTPGAKEAGVHLFIDDAARHFTEEELGLLKTVLDGIKEANFLSLSAEEKEAHLLTLDSGSGDENVYNLLRGITCQGYFTSEVGATQALAYDPIPGEWKPCIDVSEVGKAWAFN